jgi:hypothetical protein
VASIRFTSTVQANDREQSGHRFWVYNSSTSPIAARLDGNYLIRDTVSVDADSFVRLRMKADNPGLWAFHCHMEWHVAAGLALEVTRDRLDLQIIEAPEEFPLIQIPCLQDTDCAPASQRCANDICSARTISCNVDLDCPVGELCLASKQLCVVAEPNMASALSGLLLWPN